MIKGRSKWERYVPFIKANAGKMTRAEMAKAIGTTKSNIYNICYYFKIQLPREDKRRGKRGSKWDKHLPYIREQSGVLPRSVIAAQLGITPEHLRNLCYRFDMPAPPETVSQPVSRRGVLRVRGAVVDPFAGNIPRRPVRGERHVGR